MHFFIFLSAGFLAVALVRKVFRQTFDPILSMRLALAAALAFFGVDHLINPWRYVPMIDNFLPFAQEVVLFTGLSEIAGAFGLLVPRLRRIAGIALAVYFVFVFPANISNAINPPIIDGLPANPGYYWFRLALQPIAVWWSLAAVGLCLPSAFRRDKVAVTAG